MHIYLKLNHMLGMGWDKPNLVEGMLFLLRQAVFSG